MKRWISVLSVAFLVVVGAICVENWSLLPLVGAQSTTVSVGGAGLSVSSSGVLSGNGAGFTNLNATNISSGTLADARLSSNVPLRNAGNTFSGLNQFTDEIVITNGTSELLALPGSLVGNNSGSNVWSISNVNGSATFGAVTIAGPIATGITSNTDLAGQITLATGAGSYTFTSTHATAPIVVCTDTTALLPVQCSASTTAVTIAGTGSDVINYVVIGRT